MALAPHTVQNIPDGFSREPITVWQPASMTPEPTKSFFRRTRGSACDPCCSGSNWPRYQWPYPVPGWWSSWPACEASHKLCDLADLQPIQLAYQPTLLPRLIGGIPLATQVPERLAGLIAIDDLNRTW